MADYCRRCDRPVRFDGEFCSEGCRKSHEQEDDGEDDDGTYVENPDHKPADRVELEDLGIGEDLEI